MSRRTDIEHFYDKFHPVTRDDDETILWETYTPDMESVSRTYRERGEEFIWTLIDGTNGKLYLCPGLHYVNRLSYVICENEWKEGQRDYLY